MKIKTSEATGLQLDWGVAKAMEYAPEVKYETVFVPAEKRGWPIEGVMPFEHTDPRVCMGLIEQYKPDLVYRAEQWGVEIPHNNNQFWSASLAQAVARCVISMRLGDEFEVPDELGVMG